MWLDFPLSILWQRRGGIYLDSAVGSVADGTSLETKCFSENSMFSIKVNSWRAGFVCKQWQAVTACASCHSRTYSVCFLLLYANILWTNYKDENCWNGTLGRGHRGLLGLFSFLIYPQTLLHQANRTRVRNLSCLHNPGLTSAYMVQFSGERRLIAMVCLNELYIMNHNTAIWIHSIFMDMMSHGLRENGLQRACSSLSGWESAVTPVHMFQHTCFILVNCFKLS